MLNLRLLQDKKIFVTSERNSDHPLPTSPPPPTLVYSMVKPPRRPPKPFPRPLCAPPCSPVTVASIPGEQDRGVQAARLEEKFSEFNKPIQDGGEAKAPLWHNQLSVTY